MCRVPCVRRVVVCCVPRVCACACMRVHVCADDPHPVAGHAHEPKHTVAYGERAGGNELRWRWRSRHGVDTV